MMTELDMIQAAYLYEQDAWDRYQATTGRAKRQAEQTWEFAVDAVNWLVEA